MSRSRIAAAVLCVSLGSAGAVRADVREDQKTKFQLAGVIGKMVNMFGGKGAREGVDSTVAVKGDRKSTITGDTGQIVDLAEEKIYDLDLKKKTYRVTTFAEFRRQMEEAQEAGRRRGAQGRSRAEGQPARKRRRRASRQAAEARSRSTSTSRTPARPRR